MCPKSVTEGLLRQYEAEVCVYPNMLAKTTCSVIPTKKQNYGNSDHHSEHPEYLPSFSSIDLEIVSLAFLSHTFIP